MIVPPVDRQTVHPAIWLFGAACATGNRAGLGRGSFGHGGKGANTGPLDFWNLDRPMAGRVDIPKMCFRDLLVGAAPLDCHRQGAARRSDGWPTMPDRFARLTFRRDPGRC